MRARSLSTPHSSDTDVYDNTHVTDRKRASRASSATRRTSIHSTYRAFSTHHGLSWLMRLCGWITTLVGRTKAAGSFCCQRWQAESPYSVPDNGGLRWYGVVCQHYLWLCSVFSGLCEECVPSHKIWFLVKPPNNKEADIPPCFCWKSEDEYKQSAQDHRVTAVSQVQALRGLQGKSNLKHASPTLVLWSTSIMMIFLPVIWEFWNINNSFKKLQNNRSKTVCGDVIQRQILQLHR